MSGELAQIVINTVLFISYLGEDELSDKSETVVDRALTKKTLLLVSSEVYADPMAAYRVKGYKLNEVKNILLDLRAIPHKVVPVALEISILAMDLYSRYGGSRRLHYFDAFHVATASCLDKPLITSDQFIL